MDSFDSYKRIITEIQTHEAYLQSLYERRKQLRKALYYNAPGEVKAQTYSDMPKSHYEPKELSFIFTQIANIETEIMAFRGCLKSLYNAKSKIENFVSQNTGVYYTVAFLRYIDNKNLQEIAEQLHMSYDRIRHINSKIKKNFEDNQNSF